MSNQDDRTESRSPFARTLLAILKALVRITLVVLVAVLIGVGLYVGIPAIYRATIVPIQQNAADIATLEQRMDLTESQVERQFESVRERSAELEGEIAGLEETIAVQDRLVSTSVAQLATLEPGLIALQATATAQDEALAEVTSGLETVGRTIREQAGKLSDQQDELEDLEEDLETELATLTEQAEALTQGRSELMTQLAFLLTAQDLVRARLMLLEDNPRGAQDALAVAIEHLTRTAAMSEKATSQAALLAGRIRALDTLIAERSFRATPALEALWADVVDLVVPPPPPGSEPLPTLPGVEVSAAELITGTGAVTSTVAITPTLTITATATVAPTPTMPPTPTPTPTLTPTPTPTATAQP
ncbi:MAG: hypothetical protein ACP5HG_05565 [Anaerolineae bacterium]